MSIPDSISNAQTQASVYSPLDLSQRSIRLLRIRADLSRQGHIQCEVRHATVESQYVCLSYVWGPPDEGHPVLLNNELHLTRKNLSTFLRYARKKQFGWLWIDALCIDQASLAERTHQVQQMGAIFSQATRVVSWLGISPPMIDILRQASQERMDVQRATLFNLHEYWTRAWVTQEVLLAREVILMAGEFELRMEHVPSYVKNGGFNFLLQAEVGMRAGNLIYLLDKFRNQQCEIRRDRVFSLLALSGDTSTLQVDYEIPEEELAWRILSLYKDCFCLCSLHIVISALSASSETPLVPSPKPSVPRIPRVDVRAIFKEVYMSTYNSYHRTSRLFDWSTVKLSQAKTGSRYYGSPIAAETVTCIILDLGLFSRNHHKGQTYLTILRLPSTSEVFEYYYSELPEINSSRREPTHYWHEPLVLDLNSDGAATLHFSLSFLVRVTRKLQWPTIGGLTCCELAKGETSRSDRQGDCRFVFDG